MKMVLEKECRRKERRNFPKMTGCVCYAVEARDKSTSRAQAKVVAQGRCSPAPQNFYVQVRAEILVSSTLWRVTRSEIKRVYVRVIVVRDANLHIRIEASSSLRFVTCRVAGFKFLFQ